jgi:zinc protease
VASQARGLLANQMASPDVVFEQAITAALSGNTLRRQPETPGTVEQWNLAKSMAFYQARFADAANFTFTFVGSFTPDVMKPLVERYLASLPATHTREIRRDLGIIPPAGVVEKTVQKGIAPKSAVAIVFSGAFEYDEAHRLSLRTVGMLLQSRLFDTIRQELGGTYSITVSPSSEKLPRPQYTIRIDWTCDPARTSALVKRVFEEIAFIKGTSLSPGQVSVIKDSLLRDYERNSQDNGYFLGQVSRTYENGDGATIGDVLKEPDRIASLTSEAIQQAAQVYLNTARYVKVTLMPETR